MVVVLLPGRRREGGGREGGREGGRGEWGREGGREGGGEGRERAFECSSSSNPHEKRTPLNTTLCVCASPSPSGVGVMPVTTT